MTDEDIYQHRLAWGRSQPGGLIERFRGLQRENAPAMVLGYRLDDLTPGELLEAAKGLCGVLSIHASIDPLKHDRAAEKKEQQA